jgi:hypothetical protein
MTYTPIGNGKTQGYIKVGANRKGWIMVIFLDVYNVRNHDYIIFNLNLLVILEHLSFSNKSVLYPCELQNDTLWWHPQGCLWHRLLVF